MTTIVVVRRQKVKYYHINTVKLGYNITEKSQEIVSL